LALFTWTASFGKILTLDNLCKCHIIVIDFYCMCKKTPYHLLLHCDVTRELWIMVFRMFGVEWVMIRRVVDLLVSWKRRVGRNDINIVWNAIPSILMWYVWRERNARSFDDCEKASLDLQTCFLKSLFEWIFAIALLHVSRYAYFCSLFSHS
jgi:hypothetical protein